MKKLFFMIAMLALSTGIMAQTPEQDHTKPYNDCKKIFETVQNDVQSAKDCEELENALMGILALYGVEGMDQMTKSEEEELDSLNAKTMEMFEQKKAKLDCKFADEEDKNGSEK